MIPFNKPYLSGNELSFIKEAVESGKISGNGLFTRKVHDWFSKRYGFPKSLLTSSCTDALEMCAIALDLKEGDEVIVPDYTFVSTANAFAIHGAKIVFADSRNDHPGVDEEKLEGLITNRTRAIVVVHYAGVAVNMSKVIEVANKYNLIVIEDAAQAIDSYYNDGLKSKPLGTFGDFATFSFHDTKNIISGEGGLLVINNPALHS
jgi:dTDP-4-amino-4,6-dideoxygalactose transaminase